VDGGIKLRGYCYDFIHPRYENSGFAISRYLFIAGLEFEYKVWN
jgi:outer membrane translocation and assembly module TamA